MNTDTQYDKDFYAWALESARLLRQGKFKEVDIEHIAEELESMGKRDKRKLTSSLIVLVVHLLKWQYQHDRAGSSWRRTITNQRREIPLLLKDSPSLNGDLENTLNEIYSDAVKDAVAETRLPKNIFPKNCPYSLKQCLDDEFFPE
jgi:hypothetical protein